MTTYESCLKKQWNTYPNKRKENIIMKFVYKMEDLDCANCAAKMEQGILKIEGVKDATVSFLAQKLTIECDEDKIDEIIKKAIKVCKKVDSDCEVIVK